MALPAGRYGVTKNQLLKIKKLPMNTIKLIEELTEKFDLLGTAAFKNSTSVVTDSSDLVESGAVKDIVGWGNKNLLPNNIKSGTENGVTYTVNSDGSVAVNGTASSQSWVFFNLANRVIKKGSYVLSGCPSDGSTGTYFLKLSLSNTIGGTENLSAIDTGSGATFDVPNDMYVRNYSGIVVQAGQSINNKTFYPMISTNGGEYEPYHASVEESKCDNSVIGTVEEANASKAWSVGEHFIKDGQFKEVTQPIASGGAINDSNTVNKPIADLFTKQKITGIAVDGTILKEIVSNNSYVIPAYKLAVINLAVKVGTYAAWTNCLSGMPKPFANTGLIVANRGKSAAMFLSLLTSGNSQLTNITGANPEEDNVIEISATYNYDSL